MMRKTQGVGDAVQYRADIDALRAIAVIGVLMFHAFPKILPGGFTGVDIFFVISGYLISGHIFRDLKRSKFSLSDFYSRRARRILPALIVVLSFCATAGWFVLLRDEFLQLYRQIFAASLFLSNFFTWGEAGYFDNAATTKPLLHLWSLAIEEQFYLIWPISAWIFCKKNLNIRLSILFLIITSFAMNMLFVGSTHDFYSPESRFWELMAGAILAETEAPVWLNAQASALCAALGLFAIFGGFVFISQTPYFPGFYAIVPVASAAIVIGSKSRILAKASLLSNIGLISYPLYLWHWPLLSFSRIMNGGEPPAWVRLACIAIAFILALGTYLFIERPIRQNQSVAKVFFLSGALSVLGIIGLIGAMSTNAYRLRPDYTKSLETMQTAIEWPYYQTDACLQRWHFDISGRSHFFCATNNDEDPDILILGSSYANALFPGFSDNVYFGKTTILNFGSCYFIKGMIVTFPMNKNHPCNKDWARQEQEWIDDIIRHSSVKVAVLNAWWPDFDKDGQWIGEDGSLSGHITDPTDASASSQTAFFRGLDAALSYLESYHIAPVLFLPKPELGYDVRTCFARPLMPPAHDCVVSRRSEELRQKVFRDSIGKLARKHPMLVLYDQANAFCQGDMCKYVTSAGLPLLRDDEHLSEIGSKLLITSFSTWAQLHEPSLFRLLGGGELPTKK